MKVLIVPEHFKHDRYILEPIVKSLFEAIGIKHRVAVCTDPLLGSVEAALDWERLQPVLEMHRPYIDLFLLLVDRDGKPGRQEQLRKLEQRATEVLGANRVLIAENAWQEIEVWALAGMKDLPQVWQWQIIRDDPNPKEAWFDPYARSRGLHLSPSGGRETLGREAARRYDRVRQLCPELQDLEAAIQRWQSAPR